MRIALIGSGRIGTAVARLAIGQGHDVVLSNSRGPQTLSSLVADLGPQASAATAQDAAATADIAVVAVPLHAYLDVPVEPLAGKIVIDANNYYPQRDGNIPSLESGTTTSSELLAKHLPTSRIVKVFNTIEAGELGEQGQPAGSDNRRALPIAGDDADAKQVVAALVGSFGYDVVDAGPLAEGRRFQPGGPASGARFTAPELRKALALSDRG